MAADGSAERTGAATALMVDGVGGCARGGGSEDNDDVWRLSVEALSEFAEAG